MARTEAWECLLKRQKWNHAYEPFRKPYKGTNGTSKKRKADEQVTGGA